MSVFVTVNVRKQLIIVNDFYIFGFVGEKNVIIREKV